MKGRLSCLQIYKEALTPEQVKESQELCSRNGKQLYYVWCGTVCFSSDLRVAVNHVHIPICFFSHFVFNDGGKQQKIKRRKIENLKKSPCHRREKHYLLQALLTLYVLCCAVLCCAVLCCAVVIGCNLPKF